MLPLRTEGDGMEIEKPIIKINKFNLLKTKVRRVPRDKLLFESVKHYHCHLRPIERKNPIYYVKPKIIPTEKKKLTTFSYAKEPRFVPREPFKAAVTPIIPYNKIRKTKISKNNVDIQVLVSQMCHLASNEFKNNSIELNTTNNASEGKQFSEIVEDNERLENEIRVLKDTNEQLEKQLRFQTQVNTELKTLLVAAVGEDLEARVQLLTEDKLQLARALLSSAQHLSTHREQVEWLAGHCEVWRSKFLASSLMVDELARWKSVLTSHIAELLESIKCLLEEHNEIKVHGVQAYEILSSVLTKYNIYHEKPKAMHVIAVTKACEELAQKIAVYLMGSDFIALENNTKNVEINTPGELVAQEALTKTNSIDSPNSIYNALLSKPSQTFCIHCNKKMNDASFN